ncbi:RHS repeat-associated core domain-containing protein, partial [Neisseriaceae bacterium TC5R-5]|nr:RHS repeat-associated core domain-containing protein [Neisseriaceae bacterium TC5R-5]
EGNYKAWGELRANTAPPSGFSQNLRMPGQYYDEESGLHYNTFRYYDPGVGRFISPDPIGLEGGVNLYAYAPNPLSWIDPWGWCPASTSGSNPKPSSPSAMQQQVQRNQAPRDVIRVDKGHIPGQEPHIHYRDGTSSTVSGGVHDAHKGIPNLSNKVKEWIIANGWKPPPPPTQ